MFGFGKKDENPVLVGAKEKILRAKAIKRGMTLEQIKGGGGGEEKMAPPGVSLAVVFGMSVVLALLLTQGMLSKGGIGFRLPDADLNALLLGASPPQFAGDKDVNLVIIVVIRGLVIFGLGGIVPFVARLWTRVFSKSGANLYVIFWGVTIGLPTVWFFVKDFLGPLVGQLYDIFK